VHFSLVRSSTGQIPAAADSALIRVWNLAFDSVARVKLPTPGEGGSFDMSVPADTGYTVMVLAFHGNCIDAGGSTEATVNVEAIGRPGDDVQPTVVHIDVVPLSATINYRDGDSLRAHTPSMLIVYSYGAPRFLSNEASCTWGCGGFVNGSTVASYQSLVPDTPGPWDVSATLYAEAGWNAPNLSLTSPIRHLFILPANGGITVTFSKNRQH
jgi:hypothetical protein